MLVQPRSKQECLLGMNAIPKLGLQLLRSDGTHPCANDVDSGSESKSSVVSLVQASTVPSQKGRFVDAAVLQNMFAEGDEVLFEPDTAALHKLGLISSDSLLTVGPGGKVVVPLENLQPSCVDIERDLVIGHVMSVNSTVSSLGASERDSDSGSEVNKDRDGRRQCLRAVLNLPVDGLTKTQKEQLAQFLLKSDDVFSLDDSDLGRTSLVCHSVDTGDHPPIKQPPRRIPFAQREVVSKMIEDMQQKGIVQPSTSAWASPIVLVPKKDNTYRFCVDYRKVNAATNRDVDPLPRIDDILDILKHRSGKSNSNADALSRNPVTEEASVLTIESLDAATISAQTEQREEQEKDPELSPILKYLTDGTLPGDKALAKRLALESTQYAVLDGLLHHENPCQPGEYRVVVPVALRADLMRVEDSRDILPGVGCITP